MPKVILLKGLPGSGKSTWAKSMVAQHPGEYKRVNKDDLREMLDTGVHSKENEKMVLDVRDFIILYAVGKKKHVIVDDTNLHQVHEKHIRSLVEGKAEFEVKEFLDVPLEECIRRDAQRPKPVGKEVIMGMYERHVKPKLLLDKKEH